MNLPRWMEMLRPLVARPSIDPELRLRISNLTRQTLLATRAEIANAGSTRRKGLLGRTGLAAGEALWIRPCEAVHTFGMKFAIDLVYLDRCHRIVKIRHNVLPWRLSACLSAHSVIELPAGSVRRTNSMPGDRLEYFLDAPPDLSAGSLSMRT